MVWKICKWPCKQWMFVNFCQEISRNQDSTPANLPQVESWPGFQRPQELGAEAECHGDFLALGPFNWMADEKDKQSGNLAASNMYCTWLVVLQLQIVQIVSTQPKRLRKLKHDKATVGSTASGGCPGTCCYLYALQAIHCGCLQWWHLRASSLPLFEASAWVSCTWSQVRASARTIAKMPWVG